MKFLIIFLVTFSIVGCQIVSPREGTVSTTQIIDNSATKETKVAYASIRSIDFQNFTFPWTKTFGGSEKSFTLKNGVADLPDERNLSLDSLAYVAVTDDDNGAFVVININDGNAHYNMLYVYTLENGNPKVLESFEFGEDNTFFATAFGSHDGLIVGRYIQKDNDPECCPSIIEFSYHTWQKNKFVKLGESQNIANPYVERIKKQR